MRKYLVRIVISALALTSATAYAIPVRWTLEDVLVGFASVGFPRAALTGSFVFDADTNLYSDVNITSGSGLGLYCLFPADVPCQNFFVAPFAGQQYDYAVNSTSFSTPSSLVAINLEASSDGLIGDPLLFMAFASGLTNSGGEIRMGSSGGEYFCTNTNCDFDLQTNLFRQVLSADYIDNTGQVVAYNGRVVGTAIPEPATWSVFAIGLFGFVSVARKRLTSSR